MVFYNTIIINCTTNLYKCVEIENEKTKVRNELCCGLAYQGTYLRELFKVHHTEIFST